MTVLPEPTPTATAAGQATNPLTDAVIQAAVDNAIHQARQADASPKAVIGNTPPVPQPGRPPMSQGATDASVLMIAGAGSVSMVSLSAGVLMYLSQYADPVVCGIVFGAPTLLVLALARLAKRAKGVLPEEHHHHYDGATFYQDQREQHSKTTAVWAKNTNQQ
ncbi:hypothetical protein ABZ636_03890 [Streptomyces sp. NPDC007251]|uniref:hypothetical protein n=1 Tax=Streptomyces sp. NPDC007251 TaxID=3154483 RepID=UPI0033CFD4AD